MKLKEIYTVALFLLLIVFAGCSDYNKIVKDDNYDVKLTKAEQLYSEGSFNRALVLYEQVYQRHPKDEKGELSYYKLGKTYYKMKDYYMSAYYFSNFVSRYPTSKRVEEATFLSAMSSYFNSPAPSLDQEDTEGAINEFQYFVSRFPNSTKVDSCNMLMDELRMKLEDKYLLSVEMYDRMEQFGAAKTAALAFIEDYPRSEHRLRVVMIALENANKLANKSVFAKRKERLEQVVQIYESYREELQLSKYLTRAITISEKAGRELEAVEEIVTFDEMQEMYRKSQEVSKAKKIEYLEETLKLYYTFAQRYPNSPLMKRAEELYNRAERERQSTYSY